MGNQPIPTKTKQMNNIPEEPITYTLLFDMHSLMKTNMVDKRTNYKGEVYGMVFQSLLKIKLLLQKKNFDYVYAMYDGSLGGQLAFNYLPDYKSNRQGKKFKEENVQSDYYKEIDNFMKRVMYHKNKTIDPKKKSEDQMFFGQKDIITEMLEDLCVRQMEYEMVEADSLIAYYIQNKSKSDRVIIVSSDMDLTQLISDKENVCIFNLRLSKFLTEKGMKETFGKISNNILVEKQLVGDQSDVVYGVKGLGIKTLYEIMPELLERPVTVEEVVQRAKDLSEERVKNKQKEKKVLYNIINQVTDGSHPENKLYEINRIIMDLKNPLLTDEAKEGLNDMMYAPMDVSDRKIDNIYKLVLKYNLDEWKDTNRFSNFFSTFNMIRDKETKNYNKWLKENN